MFGWFKKKAEKPDRPKVYVTGRGGLYVKVEELLASKEGDRLKKRLAEINALILRRKWSPTNERDVVKIRAAPRAFSKEHDRQPHGYRRTRPAETLSEVKRTAGTDA